MSKLFSDPVHKCIELDPLLIKIINTQEFQRLRQIKQLGTTYFVYPGASHNRFEHSIGVCYLAGKLVETIRWNQPELDIDDVDVLCVKIAGLCHDLGQGTMSYVFKHFMREWNPAITRDSISSNMFDHLIKVNNLDAALLERGIKERDKLFIREQMSGPIYQGRLMEGRTDKKCFLYEIVANKRNGIDVDKWDYMLRDCLQLGINSSIDLGRFLHYAKVIEVRNRTQDGEMQICIRDKLTADVLNIMHTRKILHDRAYRHREANITSVIKLVSVNGATVLRYDDTILKHRREVAVLLVFYSSNVVKLIHLSKRLVNALMICNDHVVFEEPDDKGNIEQYKISEAYQNMEVFKQLTDDFLLYRIRWSNDERHKDARELVKRVMEHDLYPFINSGIYSKPGDDKYKEAEDKKVKKEILECYDDEDDKKVKEDDFVVIIVQSEYGIGRDDRNHDVYFYTKQNPDVAERLITKDADRTADRFSEHRIEVFGTWKNSENDNNQDLCDDLNCLFWRWCDKNEFSPTKKPKNYANISSS